MQRNYASNYLKKIILKSGCSQFKHSDSFHKTHQREKESKQERRKERENGGRIEAVKYDNNPRGESKKGLSKI